MIDSVETLFHQQIRSWPRLARGVEGLKHAQTRSVRIDWYDVFIRHIPHRVVSATAAVDPESIARRPCFLCAGNLDPEEQGIAFGTDYMIYFNPFPIVDRHLSIVGRKHGSQHIAGEVGTMLDLAQALPGYFVIYNGPECGASAPDHMHFQAGLRDLFPIEKDTANIRDVAVRRYARNVFLFRDSDRNRMEEKVNRAIALLAEATEKRPEPMINIAAFHSRSEWTLYLFPRALHRPRVYYTGELTISPGTIDLCGLVVAPLEKDYVNISGDDIAAIFQEVSLSDAMFEDIALRL
jgi:Domain of unknown function (DUF4922)